MKQKIVYYWVLLNSLLKTVYQLMYGVWKISRLPQPVVTIFGGSLVKIDNRYAIFTHDLMHRLAEVGISVINGGGPGIMQASSCSYTDLHVQSMTSRTLSITFRKLMDQEHLNKCAKEYMVMEYFFARKWLMINFSIAFAIFPGGFGTLNELFEVLVLIKTESLPGTPVVLIGKDYWQPLLDWLKTHSIKEGLITAIDLNLIKVTDDLQEAFCLIQERCRTCNKCVYKFKKSGL